ncbi:MAG: carboxypeptidase-like regulatory domain-containing protein [Melioribacteraceae bacterium]|jgi:hypothetical protein|nr:carboxypeptidase-like regulatory domain-containing protein [Melioribacteraceae bacterium]RJP70155.1 MAG: hypothetical protein C4539_06850 [Ignavibacteriales bacterium]
MKIKYFSFLIIYLSSLMLFQTSCDIQKAPSEPTSNDVGDLKFLSGKVIDDKTLQGIPQARVTISGSNLITDANGSFSLTQELSDGIYPIVITKEGYFTIQRNLKISKPEKGKSFVTAFSMIQKNPTVNITASTGGSINLTEGYSLSIPANALSANTAMSITPILGGGIPFNTSGKFVIEAVACEPAGQTFSSPFTLQVPLQVSPSIVNSTNLKALTVNSATGAVEQISNVTITTGGRINVQFNHFSYVILYLDQNLFRVTEKLYEDSVKSTTAIADCRSEKASASVTVGSTISLNRLSVTLAATLLQRNLNFSISGTGSISRKIGDPIRQLQYQVLGTLYDIEYFDGNNWISSEQIKIPESIKFFSKDVGSCHNQGGTSGQ